jgi:diacylglycerol kinase family enzyme
MAGKTAGLPTFGVSSSFAAMSRETWFVFNPISGVLSPTRKQRLLEFVRQLPNARLLLTERPCHATELAAKAANEGVPVVVAMGGDGTVNEVGRGLLGSPVALGIVPLGSGNGLARHLRVPMDTRRAIQFALSATQSRVIDVGFLNDIPFFCTAGVGFDALVAHTFAARPGRGLSTYARTTAQTLWRFRPERYRLTVGEEPHPESPLPEWAFSVTFANAGQYGNNAWIAPAARLDDGLLDLAVLQPFPKSLAAVMSARLFTRRLPGSRYYSARQGTRFSLEADKPLLLHYDGEPLVLDDYRLTVRLEPGLLRVLAP